LGYQTHLQVSQWMKRACIFVLPSLEEGLGVVLLEALASGVPCVGTQVGGIPDVITPEVGFLVPPADAAALAAAFVNLLGNPVHQQTLGVNARQRAIRHYSWGVIASRLIKIYQEAILTQAQSHLNPDR
jgi:glycosyltransferase involved in cell wall biosynthesis